MREQTSGSESGGDGERISMVAFGHPSDPRTFSGYAKSLAAEMRKQGVLGEEYSCKSIGLLDALVGAVRLNLKRRPPASISRRWMWTKAGSQRLSERLVRQIRMRGDAGPFLQIGTLVEIPRDIGRHFVLTDMTIPQTHRAGYFEVAKLSGRRLEEAIAVQREVFENAEGVFVLSDWTGQSVIDDFGVPAERVRTVYAGSNLHVPPGITEQRAGREILFVGIDWERKGGSILREAFKIVRGRFPDAKLTIVGCDPGIDDEGVEVVGYLDRRCPEQYEKLVRCYLRASCFCLPSLFDPFPNAIIEAASVGLPAVAFDNGSRREAIVHGVTGVLAAECNAQSLSDALVDAIVTTEKCREMGSNAQARATVEFQWSSVVAKVVDQVAQFRSMEPQAERLMRS